MKRSVVILVALLVGVVPLGLGCRKKHDESSTTPLGKPLQVDSTNGRKTSLLDRAEDDGSFGSFGEEPTTTASELPLYAAGEGRFSLSSSGIDDLQFGASDTASFDLRPLEPETKDLAYKQIFERGETLLAKGQYDQALILFDQAKTIDPKNYRAYVGEAFSYYRKNDFGRAAAAIDFAIRNAPGTIALLNHRAQIRAHLGEFNRAIEDLTVVIKSQPNDIAPLVSRAQFYLQVNNYPSAIADYTTALKLKPNEPLLLLNRGVAYFRTGRFRECETDMTAIIGQRRDVIDAFFVRGVARAQLNDLIGGRADYDEAVKLGLAPQTAKMWRPRFYPDERPSGAAAGP